MSDPKAIIGAIAVILTFAGYFPYFRDVLKNKTKPHAFSWFIWCVIAGVIYALQVSAGAGPGSWVTLGLVIITASIFFLSLKPGKKYIKPADVITLVLVLAALLIWLIIKQPVVSIVLLSAIDMLGFVPTIRKSWNDPYSETLSFYIIVTFRHALSLFAIADYNLITSLFPAAWVIMNALFSIMLIIRRKAILKK